MCGMTASSTLLCIHRDPAQLTTLKNNGFHVLTATNGNDGLRLFMTVPVDAIVLEYHLGFLDGGVVAATIKKMRPKLPIVMVLDNLDVPDEAFKCVDMVVAKYDGDQFLVSAVRSVLGEQPGPANKPRRSRLPRRPRTGKPSKSIEPKPADENNGPFSREVWLGILNGTMKFSSDA